MTKLIFAAIVVVTTALTGCRSCGENAAREKDAGASVSGPTMPTGMLVPIDAPASAASSASTLRPARHVKGGPWTELQIARPDDRSDRLDFEHWRDDSTFVSLDAMTLLHEAFARALPGFDLFMPRLFAGAPLSKLAVELEAFAQRSHGDIATTAREIAAIARDAAGKGRGLWVLGI